MTFLEKIKYLPKFLLGYEMGDPNRNGEHKFVRNYLKEDMIVFDVGANVGEYTEYLLSINKNIYVHCFEPVSHIYNTLTTNKILNQNKNRLFLNKYALGSKTSTHKINVYDTNAGSNSFYKSDYVLSRSHTHSEEEVRVRTIDQYILEKDICFIDFVKIDVEGHELPVITGAIKSLEKQKTGAIQFEYGGLWKVANFKLFDALILLNDLGYCCYRLTPWGKIKIKQVVKNVDNYKHSNYLAIQESLND